MCQTCKQYVCIYSHTNTKHTPQCYPDTMMHKQVERIYSKTHTSSILSKCHSCSSTHAYVCLLTSGRSGRRRLWPAARIVGCRKGKGSCGEEGGNSQAYTLSPSQRLCVYVSACARVSVCQCCTIEHTQHTTVIDMQMQGICI
jgi:hypothetical protein